MARLKKSRFQKNLSLDLRLETSDQNSSSGGRCRSIFNKENAQSRPNFLKECNADTMQHFSIN